MNFIELLQFSMGILEKVPDTTDTNWEAMFATAKKQSLAGIMYCSIAEKESQEKVSTRLC